MITSVGTTALSSFRKSYPIDFGLYNDDQQEILSITDDPAGQNLHLEIKNASAQVITLAAPAGATAGSSNYHFALRFRPDTLSPVFQSYLSSAVSSLAGGTPSTTLTGAFQAFAADTTAILQGALQKQGWSIGYQQEPSGNLALYFLSTNAQTLAPGAQVIIPFAHASASSTGGAHTTRVELHYQQLTFGNDATPISGRRRVHLSIVNQSGQKHIPLHVSFVGFDTILNDGQTQNTLTLRITNVLSDSAIALNPAGSHVPSKFFLSFDTQADTETKDWALGTTSQVHAIQVTLADPKSWTVTPPTGQEEAPEWTLEAQPSKTALAAKEAITLTLANIISSLASGPTDLYIRYENIPGYWDGQLAVTIEKTPLLYRGGNVGIGTTNPKNQLVIASQASFGGNASNTGTEPIEVQGSGAGVSFYDRTGRSTGRWVIYSDRTGGAGTETLRFWSSGDKVAITQAGNVGIGTSTPHARLEVKGTDFQLAVTNAQDHNWGLTNWTDDKLYFQYREQGVYKNNAMYLDKDGKLTLNSLSVNGNVGVGTTSPKNQLVIASQASFGGNASNTGSEPIEVQGSAAGVSFYDRTGGSTGRWVIYSDRTGGAGTETLRFWSSGDAMYLDKDGHLTLSGLKMGNNALQQVVNWRANISFEMGTIDPLIIAAVSSHTSSNALRIVGGDGGVLATNAGDVLSWTSHGIVVKGSVWAEGNKYFRIAHPAKPDHYLIHACLEGPESSVYYRGQAQLADGRATIRLPDYFEALTRQEGRTVLLTPEGREPFLLSYEPIIDGAFKVYGTMPDGAFSWEVKAVRSDVGRLETEVRKGRNQEYDRGNGGKGGNV